MFFIQYFDIIYSSFLLAFGFQKQFNLTNFIYIYKNIISLFKIFNQYINQLRKFIIILNLSIIYIKMGSSFNCISTSQTESL